VSLRGTCACCFRDFGATSRGISTRHGWEEQGGRRVGQYGHAWHSGSCMGTQYPPYELSTEGTAALHDLHQQAAARCQTALERLATLPILYVEHSYRLYREKHDAVYGMQLQHGDEFVLTLNLAEPWNQDHVRYDYEHEKRMQSTTQERDSHLRAVCFLNEKITSWTLKPLREAEAKAATIHYRTAGLNSRGRSFLPQCGSKSYGLRSTDVKAAVSCKRCLRALEKTTLA
jgi:hypothetical protein